MLGHVLGVLGVGFVVFKLFQYKDQLDWSMLLKIDGFFLLILTGIYGAAGLLLARAWQCVLHYLDLNVTLRWAFRTYGISQLAKYVPGNIFHLAGRQALGASAGLAHWPLAKSTLWELALQAIAGVLFSFLIIPLLFPAVSTFWSLLFFFSALILLLSIFYAVFDQRITLAFCWYLLFLIVAASLFTLMSSMMFVWPADFSTVLFIASAYVVAWLIGLVTPGAPAGVGVREVVLYALLERFFNQPELLTLILLSRLMTISGDFIFYGLAHVVTNGPVIAQRESVT